MGNRAVITTKKEWQNDGIGVYLHWNGGRDSVEAFLTYCKMKGYRAPDEECLFHSFRSGDNYYDAKLADGEWMHEKYEDCYEFSLKEVIAELDK